MSQKTTAYPFVLKENYICVTIGRTPFALDSSHPTFKKLKAAIKNKRWKMVPKLVSLAASIKDEMKGDVELKGGIILYKSKEIHNTLTDRIISLVKAGKPVTHMLAFMDNLYENPSDEARGEFYDWLVNNDLPITDDGSFLAYKSVDGNFRDQHTHKIDNSPGQMILGSRNWFDTNYRNQCSTGYHVCSKQYGLYGTRVLAVKVNPRDVLSAQGGKMRVVNYEVLKELGEKTDSLFREDGFSELEKKMVVEVKKERSEMIAMLMKQPAIKKNIKRRKLKKDSILKASYARLKNMVQKYGLVKPVKVGPEDKKYLSSARKAAGLTVGQVAKAMGVGYKTVALMEKKEDVNREKAEKFIEAIGKLTGVRAVTYPKAMRVIKV